MCQYIHHPSKRDSFIQTLSDEVIVQRVQRLLFFLVLCSTLAFGPWSSRALCVDFTKFSLSLAYSRRSRPSVLPGSNQYSVYNGTVHALFAGDTQRSRPRCLKPGRPCRQASRGWEGNDRGTPNASDRCNILGVCYR